MHYLPVWKILDWAGHEHRFGMHQLLCVCCRPVQRVQLQQLGEYRVWGLR